jgi:hypothetical protein
VHLVREISYGFGLHSERFLKYTIFPAMRHALAAEHTPELGKDVIVEHPTMCFLRARADETVWVDDCLGKKGKPDIAKASIVKKLLQGKDGMQDAVEKVLGRTCPRMLVPGRLECTKI